MQLIKRLTQTLSAGSTSLTFTDSMINNNSVIEVYADSIDVYPTALSQAGTSVTVQFDEQQAAHSILLLINNIVSLSDPTLATLLDVDLGTLSEDDILTYDETADKWVNAGARAAADISYDNTDSGLAATDVQGAIDELAQNTGGIIVYSTSEQTIGKWIDGKPLYEKTVIKEANSSAAITLWTDASVVVRVYEGCFVNRSTGVTLSLSSRPADNQYKTELSGVGNSELYGVYADVQIGTGRTNTFNIQLTVRYTKNTD